MPKPLLQLAYKPAEVSAVLGLSKPVVYALLTSGQLRSVRVGRRILVPTDAIEEFLGNAQFPCYEGE
jgi:excisionase family DNA binding protein